MTYADIIVDISHEKLDKSFQYLVPENLKDQIQVGMVVSIPFGRGNHLRKGYVTGISGEPKVTGIQIKSIAGIENDQETTESRLIALAGWMKEHYGSTMIQALRTVLPIQKKMKAQEKRWITLLISREDGEKLLQDMKQTRYKARIRLLEALLQKEDGKLETAWAGKELGTTASVLKYFEEQKIASVDTDVIYRSAIQDAESIPHAALDTLSQPQQEAVVQILSEWERNDPRPVLLHGVTGSGKTQVYMELIDRVIKEGKQAIVLIPEIALTYQMVRRFYGRFGDKVSVINSRLSQGERYDQFKRAKQGELQVMVGPRSALFTPFGKLGLIIIDEEHEASYKSENSPRYHARETAIHRARMEGAKVVLGSATPSMEAYYRAKEGEYALVKLEARFEERPLPEVSIIDMREQLKKGNRLALSLELKADMGKCLEKGEQAMLFLNRRGYAGFVSCRSCGHVMKCPHCDVSLSEHNGRRLICHYCGYETVKPDKCPVCSSPYIGGFKAGTQQIQQVVEKEFPGAKILRMDYDTTRAKGSYEKILSAFSRHEADILIGTQMIVKGHDFPDVTLVGVIAADLSLNADDYHSGERTFQLLTQAVGRSGRGRKKGHALIQTYNPEHYSIQTAAKQDYEAFYEEEMGYRLLMDYPPAAHMMAVLGASEDEKLLETAMHYLSLFTGKLYGGKDLHMIGPAPASVGKVKDVYRRVIYLKHGNYDLLVWIKDRMEKYIEINSGFRKVNIQFDFS
ncbi:replication restart helicase PriA [Blautia sp. HCP3S3_H10_1]|uniref:replication restart helicase PriA n=1 Tax=unclassified Blautia TaxID=2648079 RepID=UPI003F9015D5|nr:primosomal protein N' [Clostridia bacterium]